MKKSYLIITVIGIVLILLIYFYQSKESKNTIPPTTPVETDLNVLIKHVASKTLVAEINSKNIYPSQKAPIKIEPIDNAHLQNNDFSLIPSWKSFEEKNYSEAILGLAFSELYLTVEGENLKGEDAKYLTTAIQDINQLRDLLSKKGKKNNALIAAQYSDIGLNLGKIYVAIAIGMIKDNDDSRYFFSKTIHLLEKVIPTLQDDKKMKVELIFKDLIKYDKGLKNGTATDLQLKEINKRFYLILEK